MVRAHQTDLEISGAFGPARDQTEPELPVGFGGGEDCAVEPVIALVSVCGKTGVLVLALVLALAVFGGLAKEKEREEEEEQKEEKAPREEEEKNERGKEELHLCCKICRPSPGRWEKKNGDAQFRDCICHPCKCFICLILFNLPQTNFRPRFGEALNYSLIPCQPSGLQFFVFVIQCIRPPSHGIKK